jgi:GT2 family glycosyltransferase
VSDRAQTAVIIPTFNGAGSLTQALTSLRRQPVKHETIVVDNGSRDGTPERLAQQFPWVRVVRMTENVGFGRALNAGVRASDAKTLVFLNDDVECETAFVERLCAALDPPHGIVMSAGVLLDWNAPHRIDSAGVMFDRTLFAFDYLHGLPVDVLSEGVEDPLGPTGGAAAVDRKAFEAVGGFDEHFFAYLEDVDLAARLIAHGGRCRLASSARARHRGSATLGIGSPRKNQLMAWSRGYTVAKYRIHRRPGWLARTLVAESVVAIGQVAVDRTPVSLTSRVAGFRAGLEARPEVAPTLPECASRLSLRTVLSRRFRHGGAKRLARSRGRA